MTPNTKYDPAELLSKYIRINTTNPPGNEAEAVRFFTEIFDREGIAYKTYESDPGRMSIRAILPAGKHKRKGPIILLNHMDVVPANADEWRFDPFGGEIRDGYVHGRGALDMKGLGIMELLAFLAMKNKGKAINRDLIFLAVADEEMSGKMGVEYLLDNHFEDFQADLVLNEGGMGIANLVPDKAVFYISTAEKGINWLKLTRKGPPGHASAPHGENTLEKMTQALARLLDSETPFTITPVVAEFFANLGTQWDLLKPFTKDRNPETLVQILEQSGLYKIPHVFAMVKNTISLTVMHSGEKTNTIPDSAEAMLDVRLLPDQDVDAFVDDMTKKLADEKIRIEYLVKSRSLNSPNDTEAYSIIHEVIRNRYPESVVTPSLLFGSSDSRLFRRKGIMSYGVCPALINMEDIKMIHGIDEKISVDNLITGTGALTEIVEKFCVE